MCVCVCVCVRVRVRVRVCVCVCAHAWGYRDFFHRRTVTLNCILHLLIQNLFSLCSSRLGIWLGIPLQKKHMHIYIHVGLIDRPAFDIKLQFRQKVLSAMLVMSAV